MKAKIVIDVSGGIVQDVHLPADYREFGDLDFIVRDFDDAGENMRYDGFGRKYTEIRIEPAFDSDQLTSSPCEA